MTFRQWGSKTAGHPERGHAPGVEFTTSPLGQGLVSPVGMALAERILATELGGHLVDHRTWAICGDGCFQEGIGQGALSLAGHLGLCKLKEIWDDNAVTIDGPTQISFSEDVPARAHACGWHVVSADGHDVATIDTALTQATSVTDRPNFVALKTTIGLGAPTKAGTGSCHGSPLGGTEAEGAKVAQG